MWVLYRPPRSDIVLMVIANNTNNDDTRYTYEILLLLVCLQVVTKSNFRPQKYRIDFVLQFLVYGELQSWHQKKVYLNRGKHVTTVTSINTWINDENCLEDEGQMTIVPYYPCVAYKIIFCTHSNIDFTMIFSFRIRCWLGIFAQIIIRKDWIKFFSFTF